MGTNVRWRKMLRKLHVGWTADDLTIVALQKSSIVLFSLIDPNLFYVRKFWHCYESRDEKKYSLQARCWMASALWVGMSGKSLTSSTCSRKSANPAIWSGTSSEKTSNPCSTTFSSTPTRFTLSSESARTTGKMDGKMATLETVYHTLLFAWVWFNSAIYIRIQALKYQFWKM